MKSQSLHYPRAGTPLSLRLELSPKAHAGQNERVKLFLSTLVKTYGGASLCAAFDGFIEGVGRS